MDKIIQIIFDKNNTLYCLTSNGKIYRRLAEAKGYVWNEVISDFYKN